SLTAVQSTNRFSKCNRAITACAPKPKAAGACKAELMNGAETILLDQGVGTTTIDAWSDLTAVPDICRSQVLIWFSLCTATFDNSAD
ncbi:hypothetical protein ACMWRJ_005598, partial [Klebsiella pneumoniae]